MDEAEPSLTFLFALSANFSALGRARVLQNKAHTWFKSCHNGKTILGGREEGWDHTKCEAS